MNRYTLRNQWLSLGVFLLAVACSSDEKKPVANEKEAPSIVGTYLDDFGQSHRITDTTWTIGTSAFHIVVVDNPRSFLTARNDFANQYYPSSWSRFDWTYDDEDVLWYCQSAYNAETAEQALQTPAPDANNRATGCSGFAWSKLLPPTGDAGAH